MKRISICLAGISLIFLLMVSCSGGNKSRLAILYSKNASQVQKLSAKEINRYVYLRTSVLSYLNSGDSVPAETENIIFIGSYRQLAQQGNLPGILTENPDTILREGEYRIKSYSLMGRKYLLVIGGGEFGCLYGAYRLAELLGVRFYLHGDVIPDRQITFQIPDADIHARPLFELRGIQPFHDFPEGPDWWSLNEYKSILTQLPKMGMNFFGLHTYPEGGPNAEPTVWIGPRAEIDEKGFVLKSYQSSYQSTHRGNWGYYPENTSEYHFGADLLFDTDKFSSSVMDGMIPVPNSDTACNELFNRTGTMLKEAFSLGRALGIKTCVGTETPIILPRKLRERLTMNKKSLSDHENISEIYEGIFQHIKDTYPIDYYWLWTPEGWTWDSVPANVVKKTENDLLLAVNAAKKVNAPFMLATCGWVLGPPTDRGQFDKSLPKDMPFSCINRFVGFSPVERAFSGIKGRPLWAIPWMEDDPGLIYPQFWAGRMRKDALDALKYGCNGLFGIHWRTQILGPNVSALAKAAWDQSNWNSLNLNDSIRDIPVKDFYEDWAKSQFGEELAKPLAEIFEKIDGSRLFKPEQKKDYEANLYRPVTWIDGPGGIKRNKLPWKIIEGKFSFLKDFEALGRILKGPGNRERYDYWLNYFRYAYGVAHLGCILGELDSMMALAIEMKDPALKLKFINGNAIPLRTEASVVWGQLETSLLSAIATTGEMGTIANLEQHNLIQLKLLNKYDSLLIAISGKQLPVDCSLSHEYSGPDRIFIPGIRTLYENNEDINLKIIILSKTRPLRTILHWRIMGTGEYKNIEIRNVSRAVFSGLLPASSINSEAVEFYITADLPSGKTLIYPATAPEINCTIVVHSIIHK